MRGKRQGKVEGGEHLKHVCRKNGRTRSGKIHQSQRVQTHTLFSEGTMSLNLALQREEKKKKCSPSHSSQKLTPLPHIY